MPGQFLFKPIPITFLVWWRVLFGIILCIECWGSNLIGWTKHVFIDPPTFTFSFIGFEWLQPLSGIGMYIVFYVLGLLGICIAFGFRYRLSMILFTLGWMYVYIIHKTSYNNHHYLMLILCVLMCFSPAHRAFSWDVKRNPSLALKEVWALFKWQFVGLLLIVYTYAAVAKIYPDWLHGVLIEHWFAHKTNLPIIGGLYGWEYTKYVVSWGGILFDLVAIPGLLYKPTRKIAFVVGIVFHITNSITFQIGTFPYLMIASAVLFFPHESLQRLFKMDLHGASMKLPGVVQAQFLSVAISILILVQMIIPVRHHFIKGDVVWTEEGHRLSWRMMLRTKSGDISFKIVRPDGNIKYHDARIDLTAEQFSTMLGHPDMIWQYCMYLKKKYPVGTQIYVESEVRLNYRQSQPLIDPNCDMATTDWHLFKHEAWILVSPTESK